MGTGIRKIIVDFGRLAQSAGPYILLEIVLPGGTLLALLLHLHRSGQLRELLDARLMARAVVRAAGRTFDQLAFGFRPYNLLPAMPHGIDERDPLRPLDLRQLRRR